MTISRFVILILLVLHSKRKRCVGFNVIVDVPNAKYDLVDPNKTSHSKQNWNKYLKVVLNRSSFESFIKMLELNIGNKITFVVKRIYYNRLMNFYDVNHSTLVFLLD